MGVYVVYTEFAPLRETVLFDSDWSSEFRDLRQSALNTIGIALVASGYLWSMWQLLLMNPGFHWRPVSLPLSMAFLGTVLLVVRRPVAVRNAIFVIGLLAVCAVATFLHLLTVAPFVYVLAIVAAPLAAGSAAGFLVASLSCIILGLAAWRLPYQWPTDFLIGAMALYWAAAMTAWVIWRNMDTVLSWALREYETSRRMMREMQVQRGKLNETVKALAEANALLKRTTYDLAEAREEAEQARQLKSQFAANISHELRTPLHLIVGFSQMMYTSPATYKGVKWTPELRGDVQEIYESAQQLLRLIDDVLDLSQVEAARLPLSKEKVSLGPLITDAVGTARSLLRGRNLYLRTDIPDSLPFVYADPTRIRQVLLNLLNNAARFTEEGGITVKARALPQDVEISVEDTGIGMPSEQLQNVFTEFYQVDSSLRRRYGGTGLGLSICKQFVTLHGGRIWAESNLGQGSRFVFTLPLPSKTVLSVQPSRLPEGWRYPAARADVHNRVVTLSQPAEFARILRRYLTNAEVLEAPDGQAAARLAAQRQADAIIISSDACDGSLEKELVRATAPLRLPVIACSLPLERHLALAQGFDYSLTKPFSSDRLLQLLREAAPHARTVLVVDDDPGVVRLIERTIRAAKPSTRVLSADDGQPAIALLDEHPDVVLLDLLLPKVNGLTVLHELRSRPWGHSVLAVAITAYGFEQDIASTGEGLVMVRRGKHFTAAELTRWLEMVLQAFPARHLADVGPETMPQEASPG